MSKYNNKLGIFGNIERLFKEATNNNNNIQNNKWQEEQHNLEVQADVVQAVVDEYNAIIE